MLDKARNLGKDSAGLEGVVNDLVKKKNAAESMCAIMEISRGKRTEQQQSEVIDWFGTNVKLFGLLSKHAVLAVINQMDFLEVRAEDCICKQHSFGEEFFVVLNGAARVVVDGLGKVAVCHPGTTFGELSLLKDQACTASVIAQTQTALGVIRRETFEAYIRPVMDVEIGFVRSAYARDRAAHKQAHNRQSRKTRLSVLLRRVYHMVCFLLRANRLFFRNKISQLWRDLWLQDCSVVQCLALMVSPTLKSI
jgi:CRP-like cAMP-binding protein